VRAAAPPGRVSPGGGKRRESSSGWELSITSLRPPTQPTFRFRRLTESLHRLGPRPFGEALRLALGRLDPADQPEVLAQIEKIASLPPDLLAALGGRDWPPPPLGLVPGGRQ
jgi:hypothetical protein